MTLCYTWSTAFDGMAILSNRLLFSVCFYDEERLSWLRMLTHLNAKLHCYVAEPVESVRFHLNLEKERKLRCLRLDFK